LDPLIKSHHNTFDLANNFSQPSAKRAIADQKVASKFPTVRVASVAAERAAGRAPVHLDHAGVAPAPVAGSSRLPRERRSPSGANPPVEQRKLDEMSDPQAEIIHEQRTSKQRAE
jgi:hypothetical protein